MLFLLFRAQSRRVMCAEDSRETLITLQDGLLSRPFFMNDFN